MPPQPEDPRLARLRAAGHVPRHVAIIMDGNGRWAAERGLPRPLGHQAGMTAVREVVEGALAAGVAHLTLFAFSRENWERPPEEVDALMTLLQEYIARESADLRRNGVRVRVLGELSRLSPGARAAVDSIEATTAGGTKLELLLCISYGARDELVRAARALAADAAAGRLAPDAIDHDTLAARLYTAGVPDPDLLIRTSGEFRLSNFLLWQLAYSELWVTPVLWPDFTRGHLYDALLEFQGRDRRFGKVAS